MRRNLMEEHKQRFGCEKPIIGCLHLRALPGTPLWDPSYTMEQHVADLKEEAHILMELGFDGAVFANEADYPYVEHIGEGALAAYTRIVTEVSRELTIPFGVGIIERPRFCHFRGKSCGSCLLSRFLPWFTGG